MGSVIGLTRDWARKQNLRLDVDYADDIGTIGVYEGWKLNASPDAADQMLSLCVSKPSDLMPEMQGRFPIRVELTDLTRDDFVRILTEPKSALIKQYMALLSTEGVSLRFTDGAIDRIADFAMLVNERTENIGARRLHTVMERLLDEVSFDAPDMGASAVTIDEAYVDRMLADIVRNEDLSRYIL